MFKITTEEKQWVKALRRNVEAAIKVDENNSWDILVKAMRKGITIEGYELDVDHMSGSVSWEKEGNEYVLFATPYWEGADGVPIAVTNDSGKTVVNQTVKFPKDFSNEKAFLKTYFKLIKAVIKKVKYL